MTTRLERLRSKMAELKLDGLLITQAENRHYISGFTGSNGVLIITPTQQILATDSRYYQQVKEQCPTWQLEQVGYNFTATMLELLRKVELGGRKVGFESHVITVAELQQWEQAIKGQLILVHTNGLVEGLRMQKEAGELVALRKAIAVADNTMRYITAWIKPGMTEMQVAWEIESHMRLQGATGMAFEPIVGSGPNGAKPHGRPSAKVIEAGEPIVLDFGCVVDSYNSDITRTICLGEPKDERYLKVWHTVLEAQQKSVAAAKAGMTGVDVDKVARDIIDGAGFKEYFGHGLGHGVGLAVHESPRFSFMYPHEIPAEAAVTSEPGIYLPGSFGVRIEDIVLVHADYTETLTTAPKEPVIS